MEVATANKTFLSSQFDSFLSNRKEPDWLIQLRKKAFAILENTPLPNSKQESWRKINLSNFSIETLLSANKKSSSFSINMDEIHSNDFSKLEEMDIQFIQDSFQKLLDRYKANYFALLNFSFFDIGILIKVPKNKIIESYIEMDVQYPQGETSFQPLLFWKIESNTSVKIVEKFNSPITEDFNLINPFSYIELSENAQTKFITIEDFESSTFHFRNIESNQGRASALNLFHFYLGGYKGKTLVNHDLSGEGANLISNGATTLAKKEFQDIEFNISHFSSRTDSELKLKAVVKDKSHHVFTGNLFIPKTSIHVTASQINNNLTMARTARAESMPKLEVFADDVKCSHGATVGEVNEDQLFYLMSRGLTENESRFLIIEGFLKEILDLVDKEEIQSYLVSRLTKKLYN